MRCELDCRANQLWGHLQCLSYIVDSPLSWKNARCSESHAFWSELIHRLRSVRMPPTQHAGRTPASRRWVHQLQQPANHLTMNDKQLIFSSRLVRTRNLAGNIIDCQNHKSGGSMGFYWERTTLPIGRNNQKLGTCGMRWVVLMTVDANRHNLQLFPFKEFTRPSKVLTQSLD